MIAEFALPELTGSRYLSGKLPFADLFPLLLHLFPLLLHRRYRWFGLAGFSWLTWLPGVLGFVYSLFFYPCSENVKNVERCSCSCLNFVKTSLIPTFSSPKSKITLQKMATSWPHREINFNRSCHGEDMRYCNHFTAPDSSHPQLYNYQKFV